MYSQQEVKDKYLHNLQKSYKDLTVTEKAVLADLMWDVPRGRYSPLLSVDLEKLHKFLAYVESVGEPYPELSDAERWAVEDVYFDRV